MPVAPLGPCKGRKAKGKAAGMCAEPASKATERLLLN